jgi:hypothetical protein
MTMKDFAVRVRSIVKDCFPGFPAPKIPVFRIPRHAAWILGKMNIIINSQQAVLGNGFH